MRLFRLEPDLSATTLRLLSPRTEDGAGIDRLYGPELGREFGYIWIEHATHAFCDLHRKGRLLDILDAPKPLTIVSTKALDVLNRHGWNKKSSSIPMTVMGKSGVLSADYWLLFTLQVHDVLDYELSEFKIIGGSKDTVTTPIKFVVDESKVPQLDLFQTKQLDWLASERLKQAFESTGVSGARFIAI